MNRELRGSVCGWLAAMALTVAVLHWAGAQGINGPALASPSGWRAWFEHRDPLVATFAVLRLLALAVAWYLLVATAAGIAVRRARAGRLISIVDRFTVPLLRRLLVATVTAGVVSTNLSTPAPAAVAAGYDTASPGPPPTITMHRLAPGESAPPAPAPPAPAPPQTTEPAGPVPAPRHTWTVAPGECFWTIAASVLAEAWQRPPSDAEIVPYWLRLIEANRSALADPGNADLVFPGQVFALPPT